MTFFAIIHKTSTFVQCCLFPIVVTFCQFHKNFKRKISDMHLDNLLYTFLQGLFQNGGVFLTMAIVKKFSSTADSKPLDVLK